MVKRHVLCIAALLLLQALASALQWRNTEVTGARSTFSVRVRDLPGNAHSQMLHNAALRSAFKAAADHWPSSRTLRAAVRYKPLAEGVRALHKPRFVKFDDETSIQSAALNAVSGDDNDDVVVELNQYTKWHVSVGNDKVAADAYDLTTVVLQQIYHCLMMSGRMVADTSGKGGWMRGGKLSTRFDRFLVDRQGCAVVGRTRTQMGKALTSGTLTFWRPDAAAIALHAPATFDPSSVYHLRPRAVGDWRLLEPRVPAGVKRRTPGPELLRIQRVFLNLSVKGAPACSLERGQPGGTHTPADEEGGRKRINSVGAVPLWVFGICVVLGIILCFFVTCACCTAGAVAKQKARPSCWKSCFPWCCTGIEVMPDELYYVSPELAERLSQDARSSNLSLRHSIELLRRSCELRPAVPDAVYQAPAIADDNLGLPTTRNNDLQTPLPHDDLQGRP